MKKNKESSSSTKKSTMKGKKGGQRSRLQKSNKKNWLTETLSLDPNI